MKKNRISKYLSWLLRHCQDPLYIDLQGGWASVETILQVLQKRARGVDRQMLEAIVAEDEKGRYSFDASGERIRANQGHSIPGVIIEMEKPVPPEYLYHGTAEASLPSIMEKGLLPMGRQYVHISPDYETAVRVGSRHGRRHGGRNDGRNGGRYDGRYDGRNDDRNGTENDVNEGEKNNVKNDGKNGEKHDGTAVLEFAAGDFVRDGHDLWISSNGVWQAKIVPPRYLGARVKYCEKRIPAETREGDAPRGSVNADVSLLAEARDEGVFARAETREGVAPRGSVNADVSLLEKDRDEGVFTRAETGSGNRSGDSGTDRYAIPCKYSMPVLKEQPLKGIILGIHGFSGSKESTGLHVLAKRAVPEGYGLVSFDLPAHWKSSAAPRMLTVENAMRDILFMAAECRREFPDLPKYIFATSFGAYLTLLCCGALADYRIILRAPAVTMPDVFLNLLNMSAEEFRERAPLDCTNDPARPLPVYYSFYESLLRHSVFDAAGDVYPPMLVIHGEADQVVPLRDVRRFCEQYPQMDLHTIPGCDHSFTAPGALDEMCRLTMDYL